MSYQVLARKWRPQNLAEVVGQSHVIQALSHALSTNRTHHAYLFAGTRGVGKTSIARILAKCLNCETGVTPVPCGLCQACQEINQGRFIDLIEVDAASRTKVDETRELLENVQYAPTCGRYKIYIIDEVHMFSTHSFNALLKTLEEPPPYVKFLLATTEPKKLPITILSRCLQFNLKRLSIEQIKEHLAKILGQEAVAYDENALLLIADAADGSIRDALSLLDQAIAFGGGVINYDQVHAMLGNVDPLEVVPLIESVIENNVDKLLSQVNLLAEQGVDFREALSVLMTQLQKLAISMMAPTSRTKGNVDQHQRYLDLAQKITPEDCQLYYQIALNGYRDLNLIPNQRSGFEMVLLRMLVFTREFQPLTPHKPEATVPPIIYPQAKPNSSPQIVQDPTANEAPETTLPASSPSLDWRSMIEKLKLTGLERELAVNCVLSEQTDSLFRLMLSPQNGHLYNEQRRAKIEQKIHGLLGRDVRLTINLGAIENTLTPAQQQTQETQQKHQRAHDAIINDPAVQALEQLFQAEVDFTSLLSK